MVFRLLCLVCALLPAAVAQQTGTLSIVSGNGQVTLEQFRTTLPLTVVARDSGGRPIAGLPVSWTITSGQGTLNSTITTTDANGQASTYFLSTSIQPGLSWLTSVVTAQTSVGAVSFYVTTTPSRTGAGTQAELPLVELLTPTLENSTISGRAGSVVPGAVRVRVTAVAGVFQGQPVPNVGVRILPPDDSVTQPSGSCNVPDGIVLTNSQGIAVCDVLLGSVTGMSRVSASVGEYRITPAFNLQVTPGSTCTFTLSGTSQLFAANGGTGSVTVNTQTGCAWSATSSAPWITITGGSSGSGTGPVTYSVISNPGASRSGTLTIAGRTFTVTQNSSSPTGLTIATSSLPTATSGVSYSAALQASGGTQPYRWSVGGLPGGLSVNAQTGIVGGTTTATGNYNLVVTLSDATGNSVSRALSLQVLNASAGPTITTTSFPPAALGAAYQQAISMSGGCVSPFAPQPTVSVAVGSLPPGLNIAQVPGTGYAVAGTPTSTGTFTFTLRALDACGRSATREFSITVAGSISMPQLVVSPTALTFNVPQGSVSAPLQTVNVGATTGTAEFSAEVAVEQGSWLFINGASSGTTSAVLSIGVIGTQGMAAGTYRGAVNITSPQAGTVAVPVTLNITSNPILSAQPQSVVFDLRTGEVANQSIRISTTSAARATISRNDDAAWLSFSPSPLDTPGILNLTASAINLQPGTYQTVLTAAGPANQITIPVTLLVRSRPLITVSSESISLRYRLNSSVLPRDEFTIGSSGEPFGFTVSGVVNQANWLIVSPQRGSTPARITVTVDPSGLSPGEYLGAITILSLDPGVPGRTVPVRLTVERLTPRVTAVANAASYETGAVAPGEYVVLYGETLGPITLAAGRLNGDRLDTEAGGTRVLIDGTAAPIVYSSSTQLVTILPYNVAGKATAQLVVEYNGERSPPVELTVAESAPGVFLQSAGQYGAILNQNGSVNGPGNPAEAESIVSIYATGEGQTTPAGVDGLIASATRLPAPIAPVKVFMNGVEAEILYAGAAPGAPAGALQVNARVPAGVRGTVPLILQAGSKSSPAVQVAVGP